MRVTSCYWTLCGNRVLIMQIFQVVGEHVFEVVDRLVTFLTGPDNYPLTRIPDNYTLTRIPDNYTLTRIPDNFSFERL